MPILVGTASWADKSLVDSGKFYPRPTSRALRHGCTPEQLRAAAALVGNVAADIEAHLRPVRDIGKEQAALPAAFFDVGDQRPVAQSKEPRS